MTIMNDRIGLVCDSTADFPDGLAESLGLHILPVHIMVDSEDHLQGQSIDNRDVLAALKRRSDVHTKPFYPHECADFFEKLLDYYDRGVSFHRSTELSGNDNSAIAALNLMFEEDARRVKFMDLQGVSVSLGLVNMAAGQYRKLDGRCDVWLAYIENLDEAITTRQKLAARLTLPTHRINLAEAGATISVHTGPGVICIAMSPA